MNDDPKSNSPEDIGGPDGYRAPQRKALTFPIPDDATFTACRSCGAPILWIVTTAGKKMPVNAPELGPDGKMRKEGTSHFATCPDAGRWRRPAEPPPPATGDATRRLRAVREAAMGVLGALDGSDRRVSIATRIAVLRAAIKATEDVG